VIPVARISVVIMMLLVMVLPTIGDPIYG
jgi:hypothetical protein